MKFFQKVNFYIKQILLVFYLRRPYKKYTIEMVKTEKQKLDMFSLRYKIYCLQDKLLRKEDYPEGLEKDIYDDDAIHFIAYNNKREAVGTVRLIRNSKNNLPTVQEYKLEELVEKIPRDKIVEVSRFLVAPEYRKTLLLLDLCKTIYLYSKSNRIDFLLGCVESWFLDTLNKLMGPIDIVSKPKFCFNAMNYPFLLSVVTAEKNVMNKGKGLYYYFTHLGNNIHIK